MCVGRSVSVATVRVCARSVCRAARIRRLMRAGRGVRARPRMQLVLMQQGGVGCSLYEHQPRYKTRRLLHVYVDVSRGLIEKGGTSILRPTESCPNRKNR